MSAGDVPLDASRDAPPDALRSWSLPDGVTASGETEHPQPVGPTLLSPTLDVGETAALLAGLRAGAGRFRQRAVADRIAVLGEVGARFLEAGHPAREQALHLLPGNAGLSAAAAAAVLDRMAADWTAERLAGVVRAEFPRGELEPRFGDARPDPGGRPVSRSAFPPGLTLTICSGTVPGVSTTALVRSLLVGAGTLVKPGAGDVVLPLLFADALREVDADAAAALAVVYWRGGDAALEDAALAAADRVVVYGGDETVRSVRRRTPPATTLVEYRHRVGIVVVGVEGRTEGELDRLVEDVADAVVPYEQRGCVSPVSVHAVGRPEEARRFAERLAAGLERRQVVMPGVRTPTEASVAQQIAGSLELRRAAGEPVGLWMGRGWTVALDASAEPVAGGRVVMVSAADSIDSIESELARWRGRLQAVGTAGLEPEAERLVARAAGSAGASRVGPARSMAWPPPWWTHEGRGPLGALVDLVEWERPD